MNEKMMQVAQRAVACRRWRWIPGMRAYWPDSDDTRWVRRYESGGWVTDSTGVHRPDADDGALPDLDDPATLGCLLALVREAWSDPEASAEPWGQGWCVTIPRESRRFHGATEAEALVAALEAAWVCAR